MKSLALPTLQPPCIAGYVGLVDRGFWSAARALAKVASPMRVVDRTCELCAGMV
jgi:hypothetical protein